MNETEYTLPGVMRYLQTEWQRSERDRIQWDIERAEMKSRIAKLEGEKQELITRAEGYEKTVTLLQRRISDGQTVPVPAAAAAPLPTPETLGYDKLAESKQTLSKCVAEIRYLLEQSGLSLEDTSAYRDEIALQMSRGLKFGAKALLQRTLANYAAEVPALVFLSGLALVLGTADGRLIVLDLSAEPNSPANAVYTPFSSAVTTLHCDHESRALYATDASGKLCVYTYEEGMCCLDLLKSVDAHSEGISATALSPIHELLVTASLDGTCNVWSVAKLLDRDQKDVATCKTASLRFYPESLAVRPTAVWFSDDSFSTSLPTSQIIVGYSDSSIVIADAVSGQMVKRMYSPPSTTFLDRAAASIAAIVGYGASNGDKLILTAHATGVLRVWNVRIGTLVEEIDAAHRKAITSVSLSPRKDALVVTSEDGHVSLWTLQLGGVTWKGQLLCHDALEAGGALSSCWSGDLLAVGGADGLARVYNMTSFQ